jgi:trigger factor
VAHPRIEPEISDKGDGFAFVATFEVLPEIKLEGLDKIEVMRPDIEITDADCDDMIENLRKQKANWETVERKSKKGDCVIVDFEGQLKGEPVEGGKGNEVPADEEKSFKVKFPKDYHNEALSNKSVDFTVKVHRVDEEALPPLDDGLAEMYGIEEGGLGKLREDVVENMEREADQKVRSDVRDQAMTGLLKANPIEVPTSLVHQEAHRMQQEAMRQLGIEDKDKAPPLDEFNEGAENRVRLSLLVQQLVSDNKIELDADRMRERVEQICAGYENSEEMVAQYLGNPQVMSRIEPMVLEEQAVDWIIENGIEKKKKIGFKEYMKP